MDVRVAAIVLGFAVAALPAQARQAKVHNKVHKPATSAAHKTEPKPAPKPAVKKQAAKKPAAKSTVPAPIAKVYAAMPEAERLAIQSELAWAGDYAGPPGGDFDQHMIEAVKAFQKRNGGKETGILDEHERALLDAAARPAADSVGWQLIDDPATGAQFGLPQKLVAPAGASGLGKLWSSGHGQIQIETLRLREAGLPALFEEEKTTPRGRTVESSVLRPDSFIVTGTQGLKRFVVRAESSGSEVRGITILYDQATEGIMGPAAIAISNTFQGFPDLHAVPQPGQKRTVEYGTAIVADARGDLIAPGELTAGCEVITVADFGHAERVAVDSGGDLALIRLYGAQNLVPAPPGGESIKSEALTLVGIADPAAQQGSGAVSTVSARLNGSAIEPAPKLGFSGAAAIDAQGQFAGMVDLKSVAGTATAPPSLRAVLLPADAVRALLTSHGIALGTGRGTIEQSVVRIICVRK